MGVFAVTGAASGIGAATRARLEQLGHRVIGVDLASSEVSADLGDPDGRRVAIDSVLNLCGGTLDGLVTAAGVAPPCDPATALAVNYFGTESMLRGLREALARAGTAQVVVVSSNAAMTRPGTPPDLVTACLDGDEKGVRALARALNRTEPRGAAGMAYAASKQALCLFVRRWAATELWAGIGIRLNAIAPGATMTPLLDRTLASEDLGPAFRRLRLPVGHFGMASQVAAWIEAMTVGEGAAFLCGTVLVVDGGHDALRNGEREFRAVTEASGATAGIQRCLRPSEEPVQDAL